MSSELYFLVSKLLPLAILPPGIIVVFLWVALVFLGLKRVKAAAFTILFSTAILILSSLPIVASFLYGRLEQDFPPVELSAVPYADCVVLLGGIMGSITPPRVDMELTDTVDRMYKVAELFSEGKVRHVIIAAGNQPWSDDVQPEAELIKLFLLKLGVPESVMSLDGASRNTRENALNSKGLIEELGCGTTLLVTSAAHMRRAVSAFALVGISVFPVSTDLRVVKGRGLTMLDFIPRADALSMTSDAMREWMGRKVYEFRGWN